MSTPDEHRPVTQPLGDPHASAGADVPHHRPEGREDRDGALVPLDLGQGGEAREVDEGEAAMDSHTTIVSRPGATGRRRRFRPSPKGTATAETSRKRAPVRRRPHTADPAPSGPSGGHREDQLAPRRPGRPPGPVPPASIAAADAAISSASVQHRDVAGRAEGDHPGGGEGELDTPPELGRRPVGLVPGGGVARPVAPWPGGPGLDRHDADIPALRPPRAAPLRRRGSRSSAHRRGFTGNMTVSRS